MQSLNWITDGAEIENFRAGGKRPRQGVKVESENEFVGTRTVNVPATRNILVGKFGLNFSEGSVEKSCEGRKHFLFLKKKRNSF